MLEPPFEVTREGWGEFHVTARRSYLGLAVMAGVRQACVDLHLGDGTVRTACHRLDFSKPFCTSDIQRRVRRSLGESRLV